MVMGMGLGNFDWEKVAGGNIGLGNFGQITGANAQGSSGSIWGAQGNKAEAGDSFIPSGSMGGFDISNLMGGMGGMSGMMGNFDMSSLMGGASGLSGMMGGMSGMMGGMSGMGDMSGIMNGFIDLIIDFFEGLKNMFNGESTGEGNNDNAEKEYLPVAFPNADNAKKENLPGTFPDSNTYWKKEL